MLHIRCTLLVVAVALIADMSAASATGGVKMLNGVSTRLVRSPIESFDSSTSKRSLRSGIKTFNNKDDVGNDSYTSTLAAGPEERFHMNLKTIKDTKLEKYLNDEAKKLRAFKYLEKNNVDARTAYVRLGGPNLADDSVRIRFWTAYGAWYDPRHYS